jgi:hypothetical protein
VLLLPLLPGPLLLPVVAPLLLPLLPVLAPLVPPVMPPLLPVLVPLELPPAASSPPSGADVPETFPPQSSTASAALATKPRRKNA